MGSESVARPRLGREPWRTPARHRAALPLCLAIACVLLGCREPAGQPPRLIVLVTIDTLRAGHLSFYGYIRETAPFLAELAERSVLFERSISASSHTGPSHASLFTGLYPVQHRLLENGQELDERVVTLASVMQREGYRTGAFMSVRYLDGLASGFDEFSTQKSYQPAKVVLTNALEWLRTRPEEPTFVWIHLFDVHQWYKDADVDMQKLQTWAREPEDRREAFRALLIAGRGAAPSEKHPLERIHYRVNRYDAQILAVDEALGAFYRELGADGRLGESLWVVTSDHGEGLGNHGYIGHGRNIYNEQLHVPLLAHTPDGRFAARRVEQLVRGVDLAPTLAEIAGGSLEEQPVPLAGRSLVPLLTGEDSRWRPAAAFSQRRPVDAKRRREGWIEGDVYALQSDRFKVIVRSQGRTELFGLEDDPLELEDLAADSPSVTPNVDPEALRLESEARALFERMSAESGQLSESEIQPEHVEELKALGYL